MEALAPAVIEAFMRKRAEEALRESEGPRHRSQAGLGIGFGWSKCMGGPWMPAAKVMAERHVRITINKVSGGTPAGFNKLEFYEP